MRRGWHTRPFTQQNVHTSFNAGSDIPETPFVGSYAILELNKVEAL
jgi:hypothetical protein